MSDNIAVTSSISLFTLITWKYIFIRSTSLLSHRSVYCCWKSPSSGVYHGGISGIVFISESRTSSSWNFKKRQLRRGIFAFLLLLMYSICDFKRRLILAIEKIIYMTIFGINFEFWDVPYLWSYCHFEEWSGAVTNANGTLAFCHVYPIKMR